MRIKRQHSRHQPSGARHVKRRTLLHKPTSQAHMVGVMVGNHNAADGLASHRPRQQISPDRPRFTGVEPSVDHRPTIALVERINIHMIERHRQRQAHPKHTFGNLYRFPCLRRSRVGVADSRSRRTHQASKSSTVIAIRSAPPSRTWAKRLACSGNRRLI